MAKKTAPQADLFSQVMAPPMQTTNLPANVEKKPASPKSNSSSPSKKRSSSGFAPVQRTVNTFQLDDKGGYITQEFQDFGYRMAAELGDVARASMYMRLSKTTPRPLLEKALSFVSDAPNVKSKPRLFLWKLKQLKDEQKQKVLERDK
jgi:hypothetical protein